MQQDDVWIFGYGSILWKREFPHAESAPGWIDGYVRRFWQGSTDHRGVPDAPGRVVTLVPEPGGVCWGVAYRVEGSRRHGVLADLDHRERGGFDRLEVDVKRHPPEPPLQALTYVAHAGNPNYLGPASLAEIAAQVIRSRGPSGANAEYVAKLAASLREIGAADDHVFDLAARVAEG